MNIPISIKNQITTYTLNFSNCTARNSLDLIFYKSDLLIDHFIITFTLILTLLPSLLLQETYSL